jgi:exonuclease-1
MFTSIEITPDIAYHIIIELKKINVKFIVAPYEADSELAYLCRTGYVDFILTEDSDLLVFGTPKVLYKFDFRRLTGQEICLDKIKKIPEAKFLLNNFTHCMFMTACILSGCDYLKNLPKIGLVTAIKKISIYKTFKEFFYRVVTTYPIDYEEKFIKAFLTFRYQRVYCPRRKMCV